jgi:hypothetical protein
VYIPNYLVLLASQNDILLKLVKAIEKMIAEAPKRISVGELIIEAELLSISKDHSPKV